MYVVEIVPIGRGMGVESYSYFSSISYTPGDILSVPIRSRTTPGLVLSVAPVSTLKTALRAATFTLRKLPPQRVVRRLSPTFVELVEHIALHEVAPKSVVLSALLPKDASEVGNPPEQPHAPEHEREARLPELFQTLTESRYLEYRRIIRESFAAGQSVLVVAPSLAYLEEAAEQLSNGIEEHTLILKGGVSKTVRDAREKIAAQTHPLLIVSTPASAFIERRDIGVTIIERAHSRGWRSPARPYLSYKDALIAHAKLTRRRCIIGDTVPEASDEYRLREHQYTETDEHPKRLALPGTLHIIKQQKDHDGSVPFQLFSKELLDTITSTTSRRQRMFLFAARRGLAPLVGCIDCGSILRDPESGAPLALYERERAGEKERWYVSSTSGYRMRATDHCPTCGGWRLRERGVGIQYVVQELERLMPGLPVILFDHTTANTHHKAKKLRDFFYEQRSHLLVGTALAIPYLTRPVSESAIVSMDSLLAIPSWRQEEEVFHTLIGLRERTQNTVWVQARHRAEDRLLTLAARGETREFYDGELSVREQFHYPPYAVFISFLFRGEREAVAATEAMLGRTFAPYNISFYGAPAEGGKIMRRGLIRIPKSQWPDPEFATLVQALPPAIRVEVNPDRIV